MKKVLIDSATVVLLCFVLTDSNFATPQPPKREGVLVLQGKFVLQTIHCNNGVLWFSMVFCGSMANRK
ncbi:MAG: hypothetical protein HXY44_01075 [Syntrophaceae bacterium]|nr:hypothetical protein [Syntrophaceae bacterium]